MLPSRPRITTCRYPSRYIRHATACDGETHDQRRYGGLSKRVHARRGRAGGQDTMRGWTRGESGAKGERTARASAAACQTPIPARSYALALLCPRALAPLRMRLVLGPQTDQGDGEQLHDGEQRDAPKRGSVAADERPIDFARDQPRVVVADLWTPPPHSPPTPLDEGRIPWDPARFRRGQRRWMRRITPNPARPMREEGAEGGFTTDLLSDRRCEEERVQRRRRVAQAARHSALHKPC